MITVGEMIVAAKQVLGSCTRETLLSKINEAAESLANEGHWDPLLGNMDICTQCNVITLPMDVEVPLAVNVGGHPAEFKDKWFEYHLNGPGSCCDACDYAWTDMGDVVTFRDPCKPSRLAAYPDGNEGDGVSIRVYGYDQNDKWIMEPNCVTGVCEDGALVPVLSGIGAGMTTSQLFKKITRISKPVTRCFVKLVALDPGNHHGGTLIGYYRPKETEPSYRRIKVSGCGCDQLTVACPNGNNISTSTWVRMKYRRKVFLMEEDSDLIPLHSVTALKLAIMSINKYEKDLVDESEKYWQRAVHFIQKEQKSRSGPNVGRIQFQMGGWGATFGDNMI